MDALDKGLNYNYLKSVLNRKAIKEFSFTLSLRFASFIRSFRIAFYGSQILPYTKQK